MAVSFVNINPSKSVKCKPLTSSILASLVMLSQTCVRGSPVQWGETRDGTRDLNLLAFFQIQDLQVTPDT